MDLHLLPVYIPEERFVYRVQYPVGQPAFFLQAAGDILIYLKSGRLYIPVFVVDDIASGPDDILKNLLQRAFIFQVVLYDKFGGRRGGFDTVCRDHVGNGKIPFVTDPREYRQGGTGDGSGHFIMIKIGQIDGGSSAPDHEDRK